MKILQLCFFTNQFINHNVTSIDLKNGSNVFDLDNRAGQDYDLIISAPPCDQFTKVNQHNWEVYPDYFIKVAQKCFDISINSGKMWVFENPPGRIEKFIPIKSYRLMTWTGYLTNKEYILYGNVLLFSPGYSRYGKKNIKRNKIEREKWQPDLVETICFSLSL